MSETAIQQAQQEINALLDANQKGTLTGFMLKNKLEALATLLQQADEEQAAIARAAAAAAVPPDMAEFIKQEAHFVGHAVHQIRNPLTSVKGYVDMLGSMGALNEMQQQFMATIKNNVNRMIGLLADIGYINKIQKNTLKPAAKIDTFKNLGLRVEKEMRPIAESLGRQLEFAIPSGLPMLNLDGDLLVLAVNKLVDNGLRYSPAETGKVKVSAHGEASTLVIVVEDNGIGMTPAEMARLGEIYFRSDSEVVQEHRGSGLGIPIAYGLIKFLGGSITAESEAGSGSRFTLRIPGISV
jgi:signal transduction histidine kinase